MLEVVKHIINTKLLEQNTNLLEKEKAEKKQKILSLISKKDEESLEGKSKEELVKMLEEL